MIQLTTEFEKNLEKYAEVIVKVGLNLQAGQRWRCGRGWGWWQDNDY